MCAVADQAIKRKLLSEKDLTFRRALDVAQTHEAARKNVATLHASVDRSEIHQEKSIKSNHQCLLPPAIDVDGRAIFKPNASLKHLLVTIVGPY